MLNTCLKFIRNFGQHDHKIQSYKVDFFMGTNRGGQPEQGEFHWGGAYKFDKFIMKLNFNRADGTSKKWMFISGANFSCKQA